MIENVVFNLYKMTRPVLNITRKQKLQTKKKYEGTINELFQEELKDYDKIRFIKLDSQKRLSSLQGNNKYVHNIIQRLNCDIEQTFNISQFTNQTSQTKYIELNKNRKNKDYLLIKATKYAQTENFNDMIQS